MALSHSNNNALSINKNPWDSEITENDVREVFKKNLTEGEFKTFVEIGKRTGLNPFLKEIWAIKYGSGVAQIFIGRDGYRTSAQRQSLYKYHESNPIYSKDNFSVNNGEITHTYNFIDRGELLGAWSRVYRKDCDKPYYVIVRLEEYNKGESTWKKMPDTMIKKVAEAQALRMAFQEVFSGTYDESENWKPEQSMKDITPPKEELAFDDTLLDANSYFADIAFVDNLNDLKIIYDEIRSKTFKQKSPEVYKDLIFATQEKRKEIMERLAVEETNNSDEEETQC